MPAVLLRMPKPRLNPLDRPISRKYGVGGLGLDPGETCQWPQPGVPMYYPACEGTPPGQAAQPDPYDRDVYSASDVPGLVLPAPSNCIDSTGNVIMNDSCVNANLAVQQQNFQRIARYNSDPAFAASFWPSNTPASSVPAASTPAAVSSPVSATPNRVTSSPLATVPSQTQTASPIPVSAAAVPGASVLTQPVVIGGASIPTWALIAGGLAVAYFMFGGKR